jgi:hypothetical protein
MKTTKNKLAKKPFKIQETKGKISFLSKNITQKPVLILGRIEFIVISILAFISTTLPFWHIAFEEGAEDGIFGFISMRVFSYSFSAHFTLFLVALFFSY